LLNARASLVPYASGNRDGVRAALIIVSGILLLAALFLRIAWHGGASWWFFGAALGEAAALAAG